MVYNIRMRIITGIYKGRKLVAPKSDTRPTLDRAKETLFNMLGNLDGCTVLDLFAGSGQIALECLSRGAKRAVMCDNGRDAQTAINENFAKLAIVPELYRCDYAQCLRALTGVKFDLVYLDPPYKSDVYTPAVELLCKQKMLTGGATVVCEHSADVDIPDKMSSLALYKRRKVGTVVFSFYREDKENLPEKE